MKFIQSALLAPALLLLATASQAAPAGPSAKMAAKLKKAPPTAWLAHYLPDDRYKIAGGIWKYVSTNLDTYYHKPNSANMLRQPNGNVIGFPSAQAAEEAGYKADPSDGTASLVQRESQQQMAARIQSINGGLGPEAGEQIGGGAAGGAANIKRSGRVYLADGVSIITIPQGWTRLASQQRKDGKSDVSVDLIAHMGTGNIALLLTMNVPGVDVGRELASPNKVNQNLQQFGRMANSTGSISSSGAGRMGDFANQARIRPTTWGGLKGIALTPPASMTAKMTAQSGVKMGSMIIVGRGSKAYMLQMMNKGQSAPNTAALIKSFRPR